MKEIKVGKINIPIIKGEKGEQGLQGPAGKDGLNGYSPVKGVDYFTPDEIEDVTGEVTTRAKENLEYEFRENLKDISYDNTTSILTFTRYDGTTVDVDLPLELIVSSGTYNDTTKEIELTLANGQLIKIPLSDLIDDFYIKSEIDQKVDIINGEITNLKTEDSELQKTLTNQATKIEELEKENKQLLKDYKPIPFEGVSNHLEDTGELPILDFGINGGIEQEQSEASRNKCPDTIEYWESGDYRSSDGIKIADISRIRLKELLKVTPSETYYFALNSTNRNLRFVIRCYSQSKEFVSSYGALTGGTTFVVREDVYYLGISIYDTTQIGVDLYETYKSMFENGELKPFIYLASETDKSYVPYSVNMPSLDFPSEVKGVSGHYDNVVSNKNILPLAYEVGQKLTSTTGVEIEVLEKNRIKLNGTASGNLSFDFFNDEKTSFNWYKGKTYTLSYKVISGSVNGHVFIHTSFKNDNTSIWNNLQIIFNTQTSNSVTIEENGYSPRTILYANSGAVFNNLIIEVQLEVGDTATDYVEHQEQLLPIDIPFNMYSGKAYKKDGKWYRPIEYGKDYIEPKFLVGNPTYRFIYTDTKFAKYDTANIGYSNIGNLIGSGTGEVEVPNIWLQPENNRINIVWNSKDAPNPETLNTKLQALIDSGTQPYFVAKLSTPTIEEITDDAILKSSLTAVEQNNINAY